ncbi:hypothetical protein M9H77_08862 [Catharanthus roseus]|uniref:Uncharacterized protein n=1 Tax=Catharanthus roseus TaxID=4058 RepID=A0ACC0BZ72_CATRO|nr:hypothetical protein M9H77_08862 [Catharanthus roseus]
MARTTRSDGSYDYTHHGRTWVVGNHQVITIEVSTTPLLRRHGHGSYSYPISCRTWVVGRVQIVERIQKGFEEVYRLCFVAILRRSLRGYRYRAKRKQQCLHTLRHLKSMR